ncbi:hypothetical protein J2Z83_000737 [Virgibacillus natechei]|uniref:DUF4352 domain-containing protein n=1 Tax=Virgibacillus natechei TaxID=1216297 RepID=A0ABS4IDD0_9BACI|nr:DUF4352 domain-containing protein [Virgibacillus natechei]MBP1968645.1 hypothetical protein [Virgibacillus natechei]UZD13750.1 DUF4352 domain-containing protein [Virgibacillus natechei]
MKQYIKLTLLLTLSLFIIIGCSDQENKESQTDEQENNNEETNAEQEEAKSVENQGSEEDSSDTHVEHQEGLNIGETGIVADDNEKYEVTLNSVNYDGDITGGADVETFAVANITVKNIDDHSFDAKNIYEPSFGPDGEFQSSLNSVLMDMDNNDLELLEGEISPEESVSGDHVFGVAEMKDNYMFIIGGSGHQIKTYAQWEVSDSEIE